MADPFIQIRAGGVDVYDDYAVRLMADADGVPAEMNRIVDKIRDLAKRLAPKRTHFLEESIVSGREGDDWYVDALAGYALYVEMGHRIVAWGHETGKFKAPDPFLRPALDSVVSETNA
jgi:hypothetical protein